MRSANSGRGGVAVAGDGLRRSRAARYGGGERGERRVRGAAVGGGILGNARVLPC